MAPKRKSTSTAPANNQAAIWQLINDRVAAALEAQAANMANTNNTNRNHEPKEVLVARKCSYKEFMSRQPFNFKGLEGTVGLICWVEHTELVFSCSNCTKNFKVKFATGLEDGRRILPSDYKGNDLKTYVRRFQELETLCPNMVPNTKKLMEVFIGGLPRSIEGNVTASKPQTLEEAINISQRLMDQVLKHNPTQETNDYKRKFNDRINTTNNKTTLMIATTKTTTTIATTTTIKIIVTTTIITVTMTTTNIKKPSELIFSTQLRTVGMLETFPCVEDIDYITHDLAMLCVKFATRLASTAIFVKMGVLQFGMPRLRFGMILGTKPEPLKIGKTRQRARCMPTGIPVTCTPLRSVGGDVDVAGSRLQHPVVQCPRSKGQETGAPSWSGKCGNDEMTDDEDGGEDEEDKEDGDS
nr:reverse transcriptase domain-containing protein [Tanacetum cinerariifolium]